MHANFCGSSDSEIRRAEVKLEDPVNMCKVRRVVVAISSREMQKDVWRLRRKMFREVRIGSLNPQMDLTATAFLAETS